MRIVTGLPATTKLNILSASIEFRRTTKATPARVISNGPPNAQVQRVFTDLWVSEALVSELSDHYRVFCIDIIGHGDVGSPPRGI